MKFYYISSLIGMFLMSAFCTGKRNCPSDEVSKIIFTEDLSDLDVLKDFSVKSHNVEGDILTLELECAGCGNDANIEMYNNKLYMKSMPPGTTIFPVKSSGKSNKRSSGVFKYDISSLKYPGQQSGSIWIVIDNHDQRITYNY